MDYGKFLTLQEGKENVQESGKEIQKIKNTTAYKYIVTVDNTEHVLTIDQEDKFILTPPIEKKS